jgi:hypothetical protein
VAFPVLPVPEELPVPFDAPLVIDPVEEPALAPVLPPPSKSCSPIVTGLPLPQPAPAPTAIKQSAAAAVIANSR